jgi:hypothetical protein
MGGGGGEVSETSFTSSKSLMKKDKAKKGRDGQKQNGTKGIKNRNVYVKFVGTCDALTGGEICIDMNPLITRILVFIVTPWPSIITQVYVMPQQVTL